MKSSNPADIFGQAPVSASSTKTENEMGEFRPVVATCFSAFRTAMSAILIATLGACGAATPSAPAGSWQADMGRIRIAVRGDDSDPAFAARWNGYETHLKEITGLPVETYEASDYNGVIQAISAGQVDVATMGGSSYANVDAQVGTKAVPFLTVRQAEGTLGYYSALAVRSDSPYQSVADLKGKSIAYVDFNSTSGYIHPRKMLAAQGYEPDQHFGPAIIAGGATQALLAMVNGRVDAAMITVNSGTPETGFAAGSHITASRRGLIQRKDVRLIWTGGPVPNTPFVIRTDRPQAFIDIMRGALAILPYEKPDVWEEMGQVPGGTFAAVDRKFYEEVIAVRNEDIARRRAGGTSASGGSAE